MPEYKTMYFQLAAKVADALDILLKAQQEGEMRFMNEEPVFGPKEDSLRRINLLGRDSEEPEQKE